MAAAKSEAYCTLLLSDGYLPGAMVLAHSLRDCGTKKQLVALVTLDRVSASALEQLKTVYDQVLPVDRIANKSPANLYLMDRPDLNSVFSKIALWRQTQFTRLVYLDADIVALRAPDELFARESAFAAAPDVGWPDCFNSGVMALTPNMGDYYALLAMAQRGISFDGADQGLLNMHFGQWDRLSFTYNCTPSGHYQYVPAYKHFHSAISMIHFIGKDKPWTVGRDVGGAMGIYDELMGRWWAVYDRHYRGATYTYVPNQGQVPNWTVQQYVKGELGRREYQRSTSNLFDPPTQQGKMPEAPASNQPVLVEQIQPAPAVEQRPFLAPYSEWDPTSAPPPAQSRPEAANFPRHTYVMSDDRQLFQPPAYPEPPKDLWYEVPKTPPAGDRPKSIFPWEATQSKPTRVFADEPKPQPPPLDTTTGSDQSTKHSPPTPTIQITPVEQNFSSWNRSNAWDENPSIERYMSRLSFGRRGPVQVLHQASGDVTSPPDEDGPPKKKDRTILKLTDFPTEVERPSLPVTPAPVRRDLFWGEERDAQGALPAAEGVPAPTDWDPLKKLEELQRRQSAVLAEGPRRPSADLPQRELPESAPPGLLPTSEETGVPLTSVRAVRAAGAKAGASEEAIEEEEDEVEGGPKSGVDEGVFSST